MPPLENSPFRLLVEGTDDLHSVIHLLLRHGYDWDDPATIRPFVAAAGSVEKVLEALPAALKGPYRRFGFLIDADTSCSDRWAQIRGRAEGTGLILPIAPSPDGTIVTGLRPGSRIGFWLMPTSGGRRPGFEEAGVEGEAEGEPEAGGEAAGHPLGARGGFGLPGEGAGLGEDVAEKVGALDGRAGRRQAAARPPRLEPARTVCAGSAVTG